MISVILDSSNIDLAVGLAKNNAVLDQIVYPAWQTQSEKMIEELNNLLLKHDVNRNEIKQVIVTKGPGSYTGIRVALTIAKTIAFAVGAELYIPSSLEALKDGENPSICLMNARSKRSYIGVYKGDDIIQPDCIMENEKVIEFLANHKDFSVCGDTTYLGIESKKTDIISNLLKLAVPRNLCEDALGAKPIYLKDTSLDSAMKITIRNMISSDIKSVKAIGDSCFKSEAYNEEQIKYDLIENPVSKFLVAIVNAEVVGYLDFMITFDSATISQIAVSEEYRKRGVGNLLIGEMVKICKAQEDDVEFITLEVRESNSVARRFYKRHSFEEVTVKKNYYSDGENAIYMVRSIIND